MAHAPAAKKEEGDNVRPKHPDIDGGWGWWVVFASFMIHIVSEYFFSKRSLMIQVFASTTLSLFHIFFFNILQPTFFF